MFGENLRMTSAEHPNLISLPAITEWNHSSLRDGDNALWSYFPGSAIDKYIGLRISKSLRVLGTAKTGRMKVELTVRMTRDTGVVAMKRSVSIHRAHFNCASSTNPQAISQSYDSETNVLTLESSSGESCLEVALHHSFGYVATFDYRTSSGAGAICFYQLGDCSPYFALDRNQKWRTVSEFVVNPSGGPMDFFVYGANQESTSIVQYRNLRVYLFNPFGAPREFYEYVSNAP
jgi:hypothetical protein